MDIRDYFGNGLNCKNLKFAPEAPHLNLIPGK
jgi:hypothetical protein